MQGQAGSRRTSRGECAFCHKVFGKGSIARHLEACPQRRAASEVSAAVSEAKKTRLFHLIVAGREAPQYWMHLEMPSKTTLADLDGFLRDEWLECCGHLSAFTIAGREYFSTRYGEDVREPGDLDMDYTLGRVVRLGMSFLHEYDFGSTTELVLKVVSERRGFAPEEGILEMARNLQPETPCEVCGEIATQVCCQCVWDDSGWLCDKHGEEHECGEEMLLPVVNSPRVGVCAYNG